MKQAREPVLDAVENLLRSRCGEWVGVADLREVDRRYDAAISVLRRQRHLVIVRRVDYWPDRREMFCKLVV